jgi:hypothetical protein
MVRQHTLTARERFGSVNGSAQLRAKVIPSVEADRLTCPICLTVLSVPVFLPSCGTKPRHTFCLSCIDQWVSMGGDRPTCPLDRRQMDVDECFVLNEEDEEAVKVLPCRCPYSTFGCEQTPPLVEMEVHVKCCAFLTESCSCCKQKVISRMQQAPGRPTLHCMT